MILKHGLRKAKCEWKFLWTTFAWTTFTCGPFYRFRCASSHVGIGCEIVSWVRRSPIWRPAPTIVGGKRMREAVLKALEKL